MITGGKTDATAALPNRLVLPATSALPKCLCVGLTVFILIHILPKSDRRLTKTRTASASMSFRSNSRYMFRSQYISPSEVLPECSSFHAENFPPKSRPSAPGFYSKFHGITLMSRYAPTENKNRFVMA